MAVSPGTSPFSSPRRGLQAQRLRRPGSSLEQRIPAYSQPSNDDVMLHPPFTPNYRCCEDCNDINSVDDLLSELIFWVFPFRGPLRRGPPLRWLDLTGAPRCRGRQGALRVRHPRPVAIIRHEQKL